MRTDVWREEMFVVLTTLRRQNYVESVVGICAKFTSDPY